LKQRNRRQTRGGDANSLPQEALKVDSKALRVGKRGENDGQIFGKTREDTRWAKNWLDSDLVTRNEPVLTIGSITGPENESKVRKLGVMAKTDIRPSTPDAC
jgi:hypothetical protein